MNNALNPQTFRQAMTAKAKIEESLEKATPQQLYIAACVLARFRAHQGESVPSSLFNQRFEQLTVIEAIPISREKILEYLFTI